MGRPPPTSFGQCPKENVFFKLMSSLSEKWPLVSFVVGGVSFTKEWTVECQLELSPDIDLLLWDIQGLLALPTPAPVVRINIFMQYDYVL